MPNSKPHQSPQNIDQARDNISQLVDLRVQELYSQLPSQTPAAAVDQLILRQARSTDHTQGGLGSVADRLVSRLGDRWIWPASLAASLVLCTTLVMQMARVVNPSRPGDTIAHSVDLSPTSLSSDPTPTNPAVGNVTPTVSQPMVIQSAESSPAPGSVEFWWDQLRFHADQADRDGFLATWEVYQNYRDDTPLPDDLTRWMADNRVPIDPTPEG